MGHIADLNRFVDYILEKHYHTRAVVGSIKASKAPKILTRQMMTRQEHDKILALWKSGKVTRAELCERFKRSHTIVWKISVGLHHLSPAKRQ